MKLRKLLLGVVSATVLLGAVTSSAAARNLEFSSQASRVIWARWGYRESIIINSECEISLRGSLHSRTITKVANALIGYITEVSILRCARGSVSVNRESLPWHRRYTSFTGSLPNITGYTETISGAEWRLREPNFEGIGCTVRRETSSTILTYRLSGGVITEAEARGTNPCGSFNPTLAGSSTNIDNNAGARITVTLI